MTLEFRVGRLRSPITGPKAWKARHTAAAAFGKKPDGLS
jgi:hypothetical protein